MLTCVIDNTHSGNGMELNSSKEYALPQEWEKLKAQGQQMKMSSSK